MTTTVPAPAVPTGKKFQFVGGELCLDFCNSVGGKRGRIAREYLNCYGDFVSWCAQARLISKAQAEALAQAAAHRPTEAAAVLARAVALREAIYRIFLALVERRKPLPADLTALNAELAGALGRLRVMPARQGFAWGWAQPDGGLDQVLGPIARSAAELLTASELLDDVRQCKGDNCGWLFVDWSKNHSRCWCDMRDCGNRAKVRRHRLKQRRARTRADV